MRITHRRQESISVWKPLCKQAKEMSCDQEDDASQKFWNNPDLMENLLPFLDAQSKISKCLDLLQDKENPSN